MFSTKLLLPLLAASAAALPVANAVAGGSTTLASPDDVEISGAYAYHDSYPPLNRDLLVVVVKTKGQMPRRYDGLIRAGLTLGKARGGSTASVNGKASKCYMTTFPLKDGRLLVNGAKGKKASVGSTHTVTITAKDADGNSVDASHSLKVKKLTAGDKSGKPLGC